MHPHKDIQFMDNTEFKKIVKVCKTVKLWLFNKTRAYYFGAPNAVFQRCSLAMTKQKDP